MKRILPLLLLLGFTTSLVAQSGLPAGSKAPDFTAKNQNGETINLKKTLKEGPVVLVFYRGQWCPYCKKALSQLQDSLQLLTAQGATVIAVTPEIAENVDKTIKKTKAAFHILSDEGLAIMNAYDVAFELDADTQKKYKGYGIDLTKANGANGANLPVPATYVIGQNGKIAYAHFDPDYKNRASVATILQEIESAE